MTLTPLRRQSLQASGKTPTGVCRRPDLVVVETRHKHDTAVVVKDPIAMKYHRLRPDEYFVLERLHPGTTLEQLQDAYQQRYSPQKVKLSEMNDLLFRFHRLGLTLTDAPEQGDRLLEKRQTDRKQKWMQHISGVLFIRFPGVDPEPILRRLYPLVRPLLSGAGIALMLALGVIALASLVSHWDRFLSEFPAMQQWLQLRSMLILGSVIAGTKVLHELGHAVVCKHFGGECHQIGPMLLVFTPALYCDTSDSWTLPNRFARAAVGMAGIFTEIFLASIAAIVWASTGPTLVHYIAMNVMVVCSVSTLLFNANPLLRYDGYYVLSDLCDVPNMGQKSRGVLSQLAGRLALGIEAEDEEPISGQERFWLTVYAVAAFVYRWVLTLFILWFLLLLLRPYRLESVGRLLCLFAAGGLVFTTLRSPYQFLRHPGRRRKIQMDRVLRTGAVIVLVIVALCWPLPSGESATGKVVPRVETPVYIATGGHLDDVTATVGQMINKDDVIAELTNPDVDFQYSKARSRLKSQEELIQALRASLSTMPDAANELPGAEALLVEFKKQFETRRERKEALLIRASRSGRLIAAPKRANSSGRQETTLDSDLSLASWSGDPTERQNLGCYVEAGTELFSIVDKDRWNAELLLTAAQAQRIHVGNTAKLVLESKPTVPIHGTIVSISAKRWNQNENRDRRDDEQTARQTAPVEASYVVTVKLSETDTDSEILSVLTGAEVAGRLQADSISVVGRVMRFCNRLLRFR